MLHLLIFGPCRSEAPLARKGTKATAPRMEAGSTDPHGPFFKEASMSTCPKCSGLLVSAPSTLHLLSDYFIDTYDLQDKQGVSIRCVNCGYYADATMLMNKAKQEDARRLVAQAEGWAVDHSATIATKEGFFTAITKGRLL